MSSSQQLIREVYRAFNAREIDTVLGRMQSDVDWPNGMEGGRVLGHEAVHSYWTRQWAVVDPRVEPVLITENSDGSITVLVDQLVKALDGNVLLDQKIEHVYQIKDGLIARMDIYEIPQ